VVFINVSGLRRVLVGRTPFGRPPPQLNLGRYALLRLLDKWKGVAESKAIRSGILGVPMCKTTVSCQGAFGSYGLSPSGESAPASGLVPGLVTMGGLISPRA